MILVGEEEIPLIKGLSEKLYTNEDWEHSFKETLLESLGDFVEKVSAPHMLLISTIVITSGVCFQNYRELKANGEDPFASNSSKKKAEKIYQTKTPSTVDNRARIEEIYGSSAVESRSKK